MSEVVRPVAAATRAASGPGAVVARGWRAALRAASVALVLAAAPAAAQRAPATPAPQFEEGLFDVVATGLPTTSVTVLVHPRGTFLLPLGATLTALGVPLRVSRDSGLARISRPAGAGVVTLSWSPLPQVDFPQRMLVDSAEIEVRPDEVFVAASRLAALVEGTLEVDLATLSIRAERPGGFPAQIMSGVRQSRSEARPRAVAERLRLDSVPFVPTTGFGVVEWSLGASGNRVLLPPSSAELRVGMGVHGGMLKTRSAVHLPGALAPGLADQELSYHRVFPHGRWLRQVEVGDVTSGGALARAMRGVAVTNAPFLRGMRFTELPFSRALPQGWEYEVYQGSQLLGYADAGSNTPLAIPVQYGTTPLRVRLYGPAGEIVESAVSYVIPVDQLPAGEWQYAAGAGRCQLGDCRALAYGDLRHGVSNELTLQAGLDGTRDSVTRPRAYGAVSYIPAPGWTASLQGRSGAYLRASLFSFVPGPVTGGGTVGVNAPGEGGTAISREQENVYFLNSTLQLRALPGLRDRLVSLSTRVDARPRSGLGAWDVSATLPAFRSYLEVGIQSGALQSLLDSVDAGPLLRVAPTIALTGARWRRLASPVLRVEAGLQDGGVRQWSVGLSMQPAHGFVNVSLRQLLGAPAPQVAVGGSVALGGVARLLSRITSRPGGLDGGYTVTGALTVRGGGRPVPLRYGGLGLAGVEGRVFRDHDGDGRFGAGDEPVADVLVDVGGLRAATDATGRYAMWNVTPYEPIEVAIDSLSVDNPAWVPVRAVRALRPSPQQYTRADFPLTHTREIAGSIALEGAVATAGGVAVVLRDQATGAVRETRTISDGTFYLTHVRPGRYTLAVTERSLAALGAVPAAPVEVVIPAAGDEPIELAPLRLRRAAPAPAPVQTPPRTR